MATLKIDRIANAFCQSGVTLEGWLADPRLTIPVIAGYLGTSPLHLTNLLTAPDPVPPVVTSN